jgi:hypothetical protein
MPFLSSQSVFYYLFLSLLFFTSYSGRLAAAGGRSGGSGEGKGKDKAAAPVIATDGGKLTRPQRALVRASLRINLQIVFDFISTRTKNPFNY